MTSVDMTPRTQCQVRLERNTNYSDERSRVHACEQQFKPIDRHDIFKSPREAQVAAHMTSRRCAHDIATHQESHHRERDTLQCVSRKRSSTKLENVFARDQRASRSKN